MSARDDGRFDMDDPRVTAWALGEGETLSASERREIAEAVARDPALAEEVAALRALDAALAGELGGAEVVPLGDDARARILAPPQAVPLAARRRRWPALAVGGAALAAAAALLLVALQGDGGQEREAAATGGPAIASSERPPEPPKRPPLTESTPKAEVAAPLATSDADRAEAGADAPAGDEERGGVERLRYGGGTAAAGPAREEPPRGLGLGAGLAKRDGPGGVRAPRASAVGAASLADSDPVASDASVASVAAAESPAASGKAGGGGDRFARGDGVGRGDVGYRGLIGPTQVVVRDRLVIVPSYLPYEPYPYDVLEQPARQQVPWPFLPTAARPLSTFSIDVDTASLSHARRYLDAGRAVPSHLVRVEEIVNAFHYHDAAPTGDAPIAVRVEVAEAPWQPANRLVRVALTSRPVEGGDRAPANLVFLIDTSGSMKARDKLPLLVDALRKLVDNLREDDRVAIVTYASKAKIALEPTSPADRDAIFAALGKLRAGGYTNGGAGLDVAYDLARRSFLQRGSNRVILATDGDFNSGETNNWSLQRTIRDKARSGVMLSVLGFGRSGYDDQRLELLAQHGDGRYAFIDSREEAARVFGRELDATLVTAARDVRVQVELNPAQALGYRLIGYENRAMAASEFNQEGKDAGDLGAGETVVAFYEVIPTPGSERSAVDPLRYAAGGGAQPAAGDASEGEAPGVAQELMVVKVRWVPPGGGRSERLDVPVVDRGEDLGAASPDFLFSAAAAAFGMKLQGWSDPSRLVSWGLVEDLVNRSLPWWGYDAEHRQLLELAQQARKVYGGP